jgi:hypothetical protein
LPRVYSSSRYSIGVATILIGVPIDTILRDSKED